MRQDVRVQMLAAVARVHEASVHAQLILDEAERLPSFPAALASALDDLADATSVVRNAYAPSDDPDEPQPVAFVEPTTGWDFDAWMHEKATVMDDSSRHAVREWRSICEAILAGTQVWVDYLAEFDPHNLGDTPANRLSYFRFCLSEVESKAKIIFGMLEERLTAQSPGHG